MAFRVDNPPATQDIDRVTLNRTSSQTNGCYIKNDSATIGLFRVFNAETDVEMFSFTTNPGSEELFSNGGVGCWTGTYKTYAAAAHTARGNIADAADATGCKSVNANALSNDRSACHTFYSDDGTTARARITRDGMIQLNLGTPNARPAAGANYRGMIWVVKGGAGVADTVTICVKDAADAYAWVTLI